MAGKLFAHLRQQWMGAIALTLVLTGGTAYALDGSNTVFTDDIVNGEVKVADIGQGQVAADELAANAVGASEIADGQVGAAEIATGAVRTEELRNGQVQAEDLAPGVAPGASGARAWGLVDRLGNLERSKNVTSVTHPFDSTYCIDPGAGIDPTTAVMVVGTEFSGSGTSEQFDDVSHVGWNAAAPDCPAGTMEVRTFIGFGNPPTFSDIDEGGFDVDQFDQRFAFVIP
jgi:hypothetical protein